ncbi:MAG: hypothetical protein RL385_4053 [Pseudomonadota bacterium]
MEIVTAKNAPKSVLHEQLERAQVQVTYDVAAGLTRHRALVAQGAPLPAWAAQTGGGVRSVWRSRLLGGVSALLLGGAALYGTRPASAPHAAQSAPEPASVSAAVSVAQTQVPVTGVAPTVEALAPAGPSVEPVRPIVAPMAPSQEREVPSQKAEAPGTVTAGAGVARAGRSRSGVRSGRQEAEAPAIGTTVPQRIEDADQPAAAVPPAALLPAALQRPALATTPVAPAATPAGAESQGVGAQATAVFPPQAPPAASADARDAAPVRPTRVPRIEAERAEVVEEMEELARAESVLESAPALALSRVRASIVAHPHGILVQERRYVEIMALIAMGRIADARPLVSTFLRSYPHGPYTRRVESALARVEASR